MQLWTFLILVVLAGHAALGDDTTLQTVPRSSCFALISQISDGQPQAPITCLPPSSSSTPSYSTGTTSSNAGGHTGQPGSSQAGVTSTVSPLFSITRTMETTSRLDTTHSGGVATTSPASGTSADVTPPTSKAVSSTGQAGSSQSSGTQVPGSSGAVVSQSSVDGAPIPTSLQGSSSSSANFQVTSTASTNFQGPSFSPPKSKGSSISSLSTGGLSVSSGVGTQSGSVGPTTSLSFGTSSSGLVVSGSATPSSAGSAPSGSLPSLHSSSGSLSSFQLPSGSVSFGPTTSGRPLSIGPITSPPDISISLPTGTPLSLPTGPPLSLPTGTFSSEDNDVWYDNLWGQKKTPTVNCQAPCTINFPPYTLKEETTIIWPVYTTSLMSVHGGTTTQSILPVWDLVDGEPVRTKKACALVTGATTETITTTCVVDPIIQKTVDFYPINVEKTDTVDTSFTAEPFWIPPPCTAVLPKGMATFPPTPYPGQDKAISSFKWNWGPGGPTCFATADSTVPFQPQPTLDIEPPKDDPDFPIWIYFDKDGGKNGGGGGKGGKKPCNFFGCGCGPFGLPFGPGCGGGSVDIDDFVQPFQWPEFPDIDPPPDVPHVTTIPHEPEYPCGMYGCNMACGPKGCGGSRGPGGYKPACPPEKCYPKECQQDPDKCRKGCKKEDQTVLTDQLVSCTQVNPTSSSCTTTPTKTRTVCKGQAVTQTTSDACKKTTVTDEFISCTQFGTTTSSCSMTRTATRSGCSIKATTSSTLQGPACTRAALSLDDDEGDNEGELGRPSGTNVASSVNPSFSKVSSSTAKSTSPPSSTSDLPKSSSPPPPPPPPSIPAPSILPLPATNHWEVHFHQQIHGQDSSLSWTIYDSNNNEAGKGNNGPVYPNRDIHMFPHKLDVSVRDERDPDKTIVALFWRTQIWFNDRKDWKPCFPTFDTGNKKQSPRAFCLEDRGKRFGLDPYGCDISQKDLKWYKTSDGGVARDFKCGFSAFWGGRPQDVYATL